MFSDDFYQMIKKVEESLNGPNVLKYGSTKDKIHTIGSWIGFFALWVWLFYEYVFSTNGKYALLSLFIFLVYFSVLLYYSGSFQRKKSNVYNKSQTSEEKALNLFIEDLERKYISIEQYPIIIEYFTNKIPNETVYQYNEVGIYLSMIVIPAIINCFSKDLNSTIIYGCLGLFLIPSIFFIFNYIRDFKINKYKRIIYLLKLEMMIRHAKTL